MEGVSVVIPCYNSGQYLRVCLESVLQQEHDGPLEVLVGDDGSTDDSAAIAESFGVAVRVLRHPGGENRGVSATRNLCIQAASRSFIAFLDADDLWLPGHLNALVGALVASPAVGLAYDNGYYMGPDGEAYGQRLAHDHTTLDPARLLLDCCLAVNGVVVPKRVFECVGLFDESLRYGEDHDMWLRILEAFPAVFVPVFGFVYRQHAQQSTRSTELMWQQAARVLAKARLRYPYRRSALRKRTAVISYRCGECALRQRQFLRGALFLGKAAVCDPPRAVGEVARRVKGWWTLSAQAVGTSPELAPAKGR
jgi:glycosyltransferase involved in cell wall biosynthesis